MGKFFWVLRKEDVLNVAKENKIKLSKAELVEIERKVCWAFDDWDARILNIIMGVKEKSV